jgi:hypothetical protein
MWIMIEVLECTKQAVCAREGLWHRSIVTRPGLFSLAELRGGAPKGIDTSGTETRQNDCSEYGLETLLEEDGKGNATRFKLHKLMTSNQLPANMAPVTTLSESPLGLVGSLSRS